MEYLRQRIALAIRVEIIVAATEALAPHLFAYVLYQQIVIVKTFAEPLHHLLLCHRETTIQPR